MLNESNVSLPLGIFELDTTGKIITYNTYSSPLRSKPRAEVIGRDFFGDLLEHPCTRLEDRFQHVMRQRIAFSRLHFKEGAAGDRSVLLMFFSDTQSVMI